MSSAFARLCAMSPDQQQITRPLRRDAERNRVRIMEAAREVFAARGLGVTMDDIAAHAGVGVGTVYRRFPDKDLLIEALFQDAMASIVAAGQEALEHEDPWEGLVGFLEGMLERQAADRGLKEIIIQSRGTAGGVNRPREQLAPIAFGLVERAQASGQLRADVDGPDLPILQLMVGSIVDVARDVEPEVWRRYLRIVLDGLRAGNGPPLQPTPLPVPPLDADQVDATMTAWQPPR